MGGPEQRTTLSAGHNARKLGRRAHRVLQEYDASKSRLDEFASSIRQLLELLLGNDKRIHSITTRVKGRERLQDKLARKGRKYRTSADITDLVGGRIITYYANDVDTIAQVVRREFLIDEENSEDKRKQLDSDQFGYLSLHLIASLHPSRLALAEYSRHEGLKCEIQVRSILQHAWAEIEHDRYEDSLTLPTEIERRYSRLAGLLETADEEFARIRTKTQEYAQVVDATVWEELDDSRKVDSILVSALIGRDPVRTMDLAITSRIGRTAHQASSHADEFSEHLLRAGIDTVGAMRKAVEKAQRVLPAFADALVKAWPEGYEEDDSYCAGESLKFVAYMHVARNGGETDLTTFLRTVGHGEEARNDARTLLKAYERVSQSGAER